MNSAFKRHPRICALSAAVALCVSGIAGAQLPENRPEGGDPNRVWVRFQPGQKAQVKTQIQQTVSAVRAETASMARAAGAAAPSISNGKTHYEFDHLNAMVVSLPEQVLRKLRSNPNLVVERDVPRYPMAEYLPYGIPQVQAPDTVASGADGNGVKVCVIDSGLRASHEDFAGITVSGYASTGQTWNTDTCGHGTHVAGTIAAVGNNGKGVIGVSPGKVSLHIVKYFDGPSCGFSYASDLVNAANRCAQAGAKVINMSLGGGLPSSNESTAFTNLFNQGIVSVAAAGNSGNTTKSYPASYPDVISVAAIDANKAKASFSQYNDAVDIAAPGSDISSTYPKIGQPVTVGSQSFDSLPMVGSASAAASGALIDGGRCAAAGAWSGKIVLCERGDNTTSDKVNFVKSGGGRGIILYNNVSDPFPYNTGLPGGATTTLSAVAVSQGSGQALRGLAGQTASITPSYTFDVNAYAVLSGTSMASPHVAGVAALLFSAKPSATATEVRNALTSSALDLGTAGRDNEYGFGMVRAFEAVDALIGGGPGPGNQAPVANFSSAVSGLTATFTDSSSDSDGSIASRSWNFGDGTAASTAANPSHTYTAAGTYNVSLTVTDNAGATHTKTASVTVAAPGGGVQTYTNDADYAIKDNTTIESPITVAGRTGNAPSNALVTVAIDHSFRGDLRVDLVAPDGSLYSIKGFNANDSADDVRGTKTFSLTTEGLNGTWKLRVQDNATNDIGTLESWSIKF
ncbi:S8 family serine peptidase [Lysobacter sp. 22409]|uniref:S8 family serine peptidase n=1 Tax=Lysobacter sp. 22409 TaxID=3453917 RepID=UPI003F83508A